MPCWKAVLRTLKSPTLLSTIFPTHTGFARNWKGKIVCSMYSGIAVTWSSWGPLFSSVHSPIPFICDSVRKNKFPENSHTFISLRLALSSWFYHASTSQLEGKFFHVLCLSFSVFEMRPLVESCGGWSVLQSRWFWVNDVASQTWDIAHDHLLWFKCGASQESSSKKKIPFFLF